MGSLSVTTNMRGSPKSVFCLLIAALGRVKALSWENAGLKGELPSGAAVVHPNTLKDYYFCRVEVKPNSFSVGHLGADDTTCVYPGDGIAESSDKFQVLVRASNDNLGWKYSRTPVEGAVDCSLQEILGNSKESDCYLGQSVFSDGICVEDLGYIAASEGRIYMADRSDTINTCPFYLFLIYNKE